MSSSLSSKEPSLLLLFPPPLSVSVSVSFFPQIKLFNAHIGQAMEGIGRAPSSPTGSPVTVPTVPTASSGDNPSGSLRTGITVRQDSEDTGAGRSRLPTDWERLSVVWAESLELRASQVSRCGFFCFHSSEDASLASSHVFCTCNAIFQSCCKHDRWAQHTRSLLVHQMHFLSSVRGDRSVSLLTFQQK